MTNRLINWFFYGHIQISLAATGLSWLSLRLGHGLEPTVTEWPILVFVFLSTLGVYTLHRYLSFKRAGIRPTTERYNIVARHPQGSLIIGITSLVISGIIAIPFIAHIWVCLSWAIPLTFFYLTPPLKGWKRLRDIPFIKVLIVGIAWQIMTNEIPVRIISEFIYEEYSEKGLSSMIRIGSPGQIFRHEALIRILFTCSIAILFDFRDTVLDRSQKVKTLAGTFPIFAKTLVTFLMALIIFILSSNTGYPDLFSVLGGLAYLLVILAAWMSHEKRSEAWFAVVINGLLLAPVLAMIITLFFS